MQFTVSIGRAAKLLGVSVVTMRRWDKNDVITPAYRTAGNHRRYRLSDIRRLRGEAVDQKVIGYARVSSHDQKADLVRQSQRLMDLGCDEVLSDLGSGLTCKKPRLKRLLAMIVSGEMSKLILTHKDRLLRFGHELVFHLCALFSVEVEVVDASKEETFEVELTKDVITLMTVFSARLYGKRSHQNKAKSIIS